MSTAPYESVFRSQNEEHAFGVSKVSGEIPKDLSGTFLRNGPGRMELGADHLNFFDGHGLVAGVSFDGGGATFRSRFVHTPLIDEEVAKQAVLKRRPFTNHPSRWKNLFAVDLGNSALHDVYAWGEGTSSRVVAGNDGGHVALDPRTLATVAPERWQAAVGKGEEMGPMPYRDPHTGHLVAWTKRVGGLRPDWLRFVEIDESFRVVKQTAWHVLASSPVIVHDQRATAQWYVTVEQSLRLQPGKALWGAATIYDALQTPPGATATLLLVPRDGNGGLVRVALPAPIEIAFHVINAYDDGDHVVVDLCVYGGRLNFENAVPRALRERLGRSTGHGPESSPMRFVIDPKTERVVESKVLWAGPFDPPEVADAVMGRPYRYAYAPTMSGEDVPDRGFFLYAGAIAKLDVRTGEMRTWRADGATVSPCAFVPRASAASEDDGWLLTWLLRAEGAGVAILDARAIENGPVARIDLGVHLPGASHTRWATGVHLDA